MAAWQISEIDHVEDAPVWRGGGGGVAAGGGGTQVVELKHADQGGVDRRREQGGEGRGLLWQPRRQQLQRLPRQMPQLCNSDDGKLAFSTCG